MQTKTLIIVFLVLALSSLATCIRFTLVDHTSQSTETPRPAESR
jgi:hypothetical protein